MSNNTLDILLRVIASGGDAAATEVRKPGEAAKETGEKAKDAAVAVDALDQALAKIKDNRGIRDAAESTKALDNALKEVGKNDGLGQAELKAAHYLDRIEKAREATKNLDQVMQGVRNTGLAMGAMGVGGLMLGNKMIETSEEGRGIEARQESIFKAQNRSGELDSVNATIDQVAKEGHFADDDELRNATVLMASYSMETEHLNTLLPIAARQARTMGLEVKDVGNQMAKAYSTGNIGALKRSGLAFSEQEINAVKAAYAVSQVNGQMEFTRIVTAAVERNSVALGDSLTDTQAAANDFARAADDAMTNAGEGAAQAKKHVDILLTGILNTLNTMPGFEAGAGYIGYIGSGALAAGGSILTLLGTVGQAKLGLEAMGISGVASFTAMNAAALPLLLTVGKIALVALAAAAAIFLLDKALHWKEDQELQENIKAGTATDEKRLEIANKYRAKKGLPALTMEQYEGDPNKDAGGSGPSSTDVDALQAKIDAALNGGTEGLPSALTQATTMPTSAPPGTAVLPGMGGTGASTDIEALEDQIAAATDKGTKKRLQEQLRLARREEKHDKADARAQNKEQKAAERQAKLEAKEKEQLKKEDDNFKEALAKAQLDADTDIAIKKLEAQKGRGDTQANRDIDYQIAKIKAQKVVDDAKVFNDSEGEKSNDREIQLASIKANAMLAEADIEYNKPFEEKEAKSTRGSSKAKGEKKDKSAFLIQAIKGGMTAKGATDLFKKFVGKGKGEEGEETQAQGVINDALNQGQASGRGSGKGGAANALRELKVNATTQLTKAVDGAGFMLHVIVPPVRIDDAARGAAARPV